VSSNPQLEKKKGTRRKKKDKTSQRYSGMINLEPETRNLELYNRQLISDNANPHPVTCTQ
jgi:hypothetical protein